MSSGHRTMTLFITVILGLVVVILGLTCAWPAWGWPASVGLLAIAATMIHRLLRPRPAPADFEPPADADGQGQRIAHIALPSAAPDYDFSFSATVLWLLLDAPEDAAAVNPAALAVDAVLQRARAVTARQPPRHCALTQHQLDAALATMNVDATGRVMAMARDVALALPEHDRERLVKLADVRKDEDVWEHERNYERNKRSYLGDDVLKDPGSAVVWWLSRNEQEIEGAVERIGMLAQLSAAANNDTVAPPFEHLVAPPRVDVHEEDHLSAAPHGERLDMDGVSFDAFPSDQAVDSFLAWFGFSAEDPDVRLFAERLTRLATAHGKTEVVDALRHRFASDPPERGETEPRRSEERDE
ncbi:hypothetical protein G3I35_37200 [Streptomyces sp. SID10815]|nr:hypothetical protein [Streptomyces sp. SID10815]